MEMVIKEMRRKYRPHWTPRPKKKNESDEGTRHWLVLPRFQMTRKFTNLPPFRKSTNAKARSFCKC
ncbi:hypothetical protein KIN20_032076 [Parelaphostrongylus tenuis]|uniref:Uncharacterized protein n=1 Tax=Parelaphostrongylus tenuis TaxID=148309 RepID=A0AAD5R6F2_PARTN|nr:hypothetical protein KIN20_032076 [Parelaphostrongylus tenuis]